MLAAATATSNPLNVTYTMKISARHYSAALLISAASFTAVSCKKDEPASSGNAASTAPAGAAASGEAAVSSTSWGFAARLPKTTEGFVAFYRVSDLWNGLKNSNLVKQIMSNPVLAKEMELDSLKAAWEQNGQLKEAAVMLEEFAGQEVLIAMPEGFTGNVMKMVKALGPIITNAFTSGMQRSIKLAAEGQVAAPEKSSFERFMGSQTPAQMQAMLTNLTEADMPALIVAMKAGGARAKLDGLVKQALDSMPPDAQQVLEKGNFKDGKYEFQSLTLHVSKALPLREADTMKAEFSKMAGDPAKGAALAEKVLAKTIELSWGWVDDHFVLALGKDHSHVRFAGGGDSVLSLPEVSSRAAAWQAKKPFSLSYVSQKTIRGLSEAFGGMTDTLVSMMEMGASSSPFPLDGMIADVKKLGARATELWPNDASAMVGAAWWDGGIHSESFGGAKPRALDASQPLTYGSLAGPATVFLYESRVNEAESDKSFAFFEEVCGTIYASYKKNIKPKLPAEMQGNIGMGEAIGIPMVKGLWKSVQDFRAALGSESAVLVNLDGAMPDLPQVPAEMKAAKIPRMLMVSDLKDPAKLAESWKGVGSVISTVIGLTKAPIKAEPTEKKSGATTVWGWELPMDTGDLWPHTGVSGTHWFVGTSPSFTNEAAAKTPAPAGPASGAHVRINFTAVWDYVTSMVPLMPNLPEQKKNMTDVLELCRALSEIDARTGEDKGDMHNTLFIGIRDVK